MKIILAVFFLSGSLYAQNALWIDLSGPWLSRAGEDNPAFADPGYDDRNWTPYILPARAMERTEGYLWLRKTVDLPAGAKGDSLALTLGTWNQVYEVFVNGMPAGASGNLTVQDYQIPRPLSFRLPLIQGSRITIAIRSLFLPKSLPGPWRGEATGPFLLTGATQVPNELTQSYFNRLRVNYMAIAAISLLIGGLGLMLLLAWLRERSQKALLWFVGCLLASCTLVLLRFSVLQSETAYPYSWLWIEQLVAAFGVMTLVAFAASVYGLRQPWIWSLIWISPMSAVVARWSGNNSAFRIPLAILCYAGISMTAYGWWRTRKPGFERRQLLLAVALCMTLYLRSNGFVYLGLSSTQWLLEPFLIDLFQLSIFVLAIPISWELLVRLRDDGIEGERLKGEMQAARLVQRLFLASRPAHIDVVYEPAHEVGGDFAFVFPLEDGSHLIAAGDVSGKGLKAAMIVSVIAGALRNRRSNEPAELLAELNQVLADSPDRGFVTATIVRSSPLGELQLASAGNPPAYIAGSELEMDAGLPLGVSKDAAYASRTASLQEGDQLTIVSDGVVEAENSNRELFGFDRTREISMKSAQEISEVAKAWGQTDDITVVTVRRLEQ